MYILNLDNFLPVVGQFTIIAGYDYTLYTITATDSPNNLPLLLRLARASRHDSGTFVAAYDQLRHLYPDISFSKALLDSARDAYEIYRLLNSHTAVLKQPLFTKLGLISRSA